MNTVNTWTTTEIPVRPLPTEDPPAQPTALPSSVRTLGRVFEHTCDRTPGRAAVVVGASTLTYLQLDRRANQLAHLLIERGVGEGTTVGILLERSEATYVTLLAVLKAGAAYVPLDASFPADRVAYIAEDAGLCDLVTTSGTREVTRGLPCAVLELDEAASDLAAAPSTRPGRDVDPASLSYVIYTSGSTGKPKGVAISHASIVNFLRVATPVYGVTSEDRVYQGMSISFDFHLEEMWPAWVAGATLVAGPTDSRRFGEGLVQFLVENRVTVFCSVPTLLTTIEDDPETVRCLLVSGEAMPEDLVRRWWRPDRRILNCYGPTETTVSSSCAELVPDRPVTLGSPFPSYRFYVLDEDLRPVPPGDVGEICIGGPGTAVGYLNRPELTAERFIDNPIEADRGAVPRVYRTGDLGRVTPVGEYEYLGRIDTQVKIRGYRVELGEIEQAIRADGAVENAVVATLERDGVAQDLVGYVTVHERTGPDGEAQLRERLHAALRRRLPSYMVPSYIEVLDAFPLLAADKVNRSALPPPTSPPLGSRSGEHVAPGTALEQELATAFQEALGVPRVSVEDDFFCDLGGHSLSAARLISQLRQQPRMAGLAMGDLYAHPTVRDLAVFVEEELSALTLTGDVASDHRRPPLRHSSRRVWACGAAQVTLDLVWLLAWAAPGLALVYAVVLFEWHLQVPVVGLPPAVRSLLSDPSPGETAVIVVIWVLWVLATLFLVPVVVSRLVMRGVRPGWYPMWGVTYLRFWFYGRVTALAPLAVLSGTPFEAPYLRLLGARVGRRCQLASSTIGLPMFVELGDGVSINQGASVQPYVLEAGWLRLAPVRMGADSYLGVGSTVLAGAEIGHRACIGDKALVHADARIPAGEHWTGSPIRKVPTVSPLLEAMAERADQRRWTIPVLLGYLVGMVGLALLPTVALAPSAVLIAYVTVRNGLAWGIASTLAAAPLSVLFTCTLLIIVKRTVAPRMQPGIHPARGWFGVREWFAKNLAGESVALVHTLYCTLYVIPFLRGFGLRFGRWCEIAVPAYINPDTTVTGDQTFLAGGITISPAVHHRGCLALNQAEMGRRSFLGNVALLPGTSRMGDNSLVGVHSVAPARVDPETTWLGSPALFLPRRQESQAFPDKLTYNPTPAMVAGRLALEVFRVTLPAIVLLTTALAGIYATVRLITVLPPLVLLAVLPGLGLAFVAAETLCVVLVKWLVVGRYRPRVEPYWGTWVRGTELVTGLFETLARPLVVLTAGTPLLPVALRFLGVHVGRRVYITTSGGTEFDLISIGDDAVISEGAITQTHLFEDRVMKMSRVEVRAGATVGSGSVVLYDAAVGAGAYLDGMSLVMKGEALPPHTRWRGIPARPL